MKGIHDNFSDWKNIKNEDDIAALMEEFGYFHDAEIRGFTFRRKERFIVEEKRYHFINGFSLPQINHLEKDINTADFLFGRLIDLHKSRVPAVQMLLLSFGDVQKMEISPAGPDFCTFFWDSEFKKEGDLFIWKGISGSFDSEYDSLITCRNVRWRKVNYSESRRSDG